MTSRLLRNLIVASLALGLAGCGDAFNAGPLSYVENERLAVDLKGKTGFDYNLPIDQIDQEIAVIEAGIDRLNAAHSPERDTTGT